MQVRSNEFCSLFERSFSVGAAAAGLVRKRGQALKWTYQAAGEPALAIGFRSNRRNLDRYPFEFMPDILWSGPRHDPRDTGEVSFYQYALPEEIEAVASLQKRVIDSFIAEMQLESELANERSLVSTLAFACGLKVVPNHHRWLPYWKTEDATAWGNLFGGSIAGWLSRFRAKPETLETWCWRELWSK